MDSKDIIIIILSIFAIPTLLIIGGFILQWILDKLYEWGWIEDAR